ncbi:MAG: hypothetical protein ABSG25_09130, partial [Bryobacteraceae bacterium]
ALGIAGLVAGGIFYWLSLKSVEPVYRVPSVEVVARKESPRLTMSWDGQPIEKLCVSRVEFWNKGKLPIRHDDLPSSDPLRIVATKPVRILSAETTNVSRNKLSFSLHVEPTAVFIGINGDDALDRMDGGAIRVLFTGDCQTDFEVRGRVVGSSGFVRGNSNPSGWGNTLVGLSFITILIFALKIMEWLSDRPHGCLLTAILFPVGFLLAILCASFVLGLLVIPAPPWSPFQ